MSSVSITLDELVALEYYEMNLYMLDKERQKIVARGRLTPAEDNRLNAIDAEIEHWASAIEEIDPEYWTDETV
jgi:hypothetical protein